MSKTTIQPAGQLTKGANFGTWQNEKCSNCFEVKEIIYKFVLSNLTIKSCQKCFVDHHDSDKFHNKVK